MPGREHQQSEGNLKSTVWVDSPFKGCQLLGSLLWRTVKGTLFLGPLLMETSVLLHRIHEADGWSRVDAAYQSCVPLHAPRQARGAQNTIQALLVG